LLTALGVRVEVHAGAVGWPRAGAGHGPGQLVVANRVGWLDDLALLTVVRGIPVAGAGAARMPVAGSFCRGLGAVVQDGSHTVPATVAAVTGLLESGSTVTVRPEVGSAATGMGRFTPGLFQAAVAAGAPVCPVAVRYRSAGTGPDAQWAGAPTWRGLARVVGTRDLVVEVHLLPALHPGSAGRRELAALAEYAVAAVVEAGRPTVVRPAAGLPLVAQPAVDLPPVVRPPAPGRPTRRARARRAVAARRPSRAG
jgi:1-acyl-sn-glycerol-3-phosphate acyltransferase